LIDGKSVKKKPKKIARWFPKTEHTDLADSRG